MCTHWAWVHFLWRGCQLQPLEFVLSQVESQLGVAQQPFGVF